MHELFLKSKVCKNFGVKTLKIQGISKNLIKNHNIRFLSEKQTKKALKNLFSLDNYASPSILTY